MKKTIIFSLLAAAMVACAGGKTETTETTEVAEEAAPTANISGEWRLNDHAVMDEMGEFDPESNYILSLDAANGTFTMNTDCNTITGNIVVSGDSITFSNMASTLMDCPDMRVEPAMNTILPMITTYTLVGDSLLILRSDARIMAQFSNYKAE